METEEIEMETEKELEMEMGKGRRSRAGGTHHLAGNGRQCMCLVVKKVKWR